MRQYYYLIASLPMLERGMKIPLSCSDFFTRCEAELSAEDFKIIKRVSISPSEDTRDSLPTLRKWKIFDRALRNEIVRFRAGKKHKDPVNYIRGEDSPDPFLAGFSHWVYNEDSPLEAELALDRMRWEKIEELGKGHYFDIDYLITYALRLQILGRWERINSGGGMEILQGMIA